MTLYRVTEPNEISINAKPYKLKGGVTTSLVAQYPPKQITGDYTQDSQPYASIHTWHDWRGGTGIDRWLDGKDDARSWFSTCWTRQRNHLVLPPLVTSTASAGAAFLAIAELAGSIYVVISGPSILKYDNTGDSWSAGLATPGAVPVTFGNTALSNAQIGSSRYIIFGNSTGYDYSTDGSSWSASTKNAYQLALWDGKLWGIDTGGQLWHTNTVGSAEVNDAVCPQLADGKLVLFVGPDAAGEPILYAYTGLGLFAHDFANARFVKTGVPVLDSELTNATECLTWNGKIYIMSRRALLEYDPATGVVASIGPDQDDGTPSLYSVSGRSLEATPDSLMLGTLADASGNSALIWAWNGKAWQVVVNLGSAAGVTAAHLHYSSAYSSNRLWYAAGNVQTLKWVPYSGVSTFPKQDANATYASSAFHKTPWFDAGQNEVTKTLLEVQVVTQDCDANDTVAVAIAYDYTEGSSDASYTTLGTIVTNGKTTYKIPDSTTPTGTDFNSLRIKLTLAGGASTTSPDVESVTLVYRKKLPVKTTHEFVLDLTGEYKGRSPKEMRADLVTAASATTKVQLTYREDTGNTRNWFVDLVSVKGLEQSGYEEKGEVSCVAVEP